MQQDKFVKAKTKCERAPKYDQTAFCSTLKSVLYSQNRTFIIPVDAPQYVSIPSHNYSEGDQP